LRRDKIIRRVMTWVKPKTHLAIGSKPIESVQCPGWKKWSQMINTLRKLQWEVP
jgi:hypothetical protein